MQCVIKSSRLFSDADFLVIQCVIISYRCFSHSPFPVPQCVIKSFTLYDAITYAFHRAFLELPITGWAYIKTCPPAMQLQTTLAHNLFIYMQPTRHASENASLPAPHMERVSILPLSMVSKDDHLFGADHVWKDVMGVSWHWWNWLCRLLYIDFINWWFHLQYCY
jgi:hypothetical protein